MSNVNEIPNLGTSKDGNELFSSIAATYSNSPTSPEASKLSGHRRDRYVGDDASSLVGSSANDVEAPQKEPANSAKFGYDPKECTGSVRSGHLYRTVIPKDSTNKDGKVFPIAVGFCLRNCGVHCNQNPFDRVCPKNPNVQFQNNQMIRTYTFVSSDE